MLTTKQELFTINLFNDMTQRDAWINAGYSSNYPIAIVDQNACRMAARSKIKARLKELRDQAATPTIVNVTERKERLSTFVREDIVTEKGMKLRHGNIQAIAELNRMEGEYSPEKHEIKTEVLLTMKLMLPNGTEYRPKVETDKPKELTAGNVVDT